MSARPTWKIKIACYNHWVFRDDNRAAIERANELQRELDKERQKRKQLEHRLEHGDKDLPDSSATAWLILGCIGMLFVFIAPMVWLGANQQISKIRNGQLKFNGLKTAAVALRLGQLGSALLLLAIIVFSLPSSTPKFREPNNQYLADALAKIESAQTPHEIDNAMAYYCDSTKHDHFDSFEAACKQAFLRLEEKSAPLIKKRRDAGESVHSLCYPLTKRTASWGVKTSAAITLLCQEGRAMEHSYKNLNVEVAKRIAIQELKLPFQCGMLVDRLLKLNSDWSNRKAKEIATLCYVELGHLILEEEAADTDSSICSYHARSVHKYVSLLNLSDKRIDKNMAILTRCSTK